MLPYHGFGAAIAMEDAVVLGRAMTDATDPLEGLRRYEKARVPRGTAAILSSRRLGERYMGGRGVELCTLPLDDPDLFRYDARSAAIAH
jgi:salicylate hydroxylase